MSGIRYRGLYMYMYLTFNNIYLPCSVLMVLKYFKKDMMWAWTNTWLCKL